MTSSTRTRGRTARRVTAAVAAAALSLSAVSVVSAVTAGAASASPAHSAHRAHPGPDRAALQAALDRLVDTGAVGAVAEVRDEHGVWRGTSGRAALGSRRRVPVDSRVRVGSVTKSFVATVVLQLVAEGRLRLDDPVSRWLPGSVPGGDRITVRELLGHTSGLHDYQETLPMPPSADFLAVVSRTWTPAELVDRAVTQPTTSAPGAAYHYSSTGYVLLGEIIEAVTGRPYATEIEHRIIRPLGLNATSVPGTSSTIPGPHPHGYVPIASDGATRLVDLTRMNPSVMGASGEIISTPRDLDVFFAALLRGHLLPPRLLAEMLAPSVPGGPYGLGLFRRRTPCGIEVYGHDGDAVAYQTWSFSTAGAHRQVTLALTPDHRADLDDQVDAYVDAVVCS